MSQGKKLLVLGHANAGIFFIIKQEGGISKKEEKSHKKKRNELKGANLV